MSSRRIAPHASRGRLARPWDWTAKKQWLARVFIFGLMFCTFGGCPNAYLAEQKGPQSGPGSTPEQRLAKLESIVSVLSQELVNVQRVFWSEKLCQKSKDKIVAFMAEVQKSSSSVCTPMELEKALAFMNSQPVTFVYLDKNRGLSSLHSARAGYIRDNLLSEQNLHPSTRVLILVQPFGDSPDAIQGSLTIAKGLADKIRNDLPTIPNRNVPVLGPHLLPCNLQGEAGLQRLYGGSQFTKLSESLPGEPSAKQPRVRIWVFRTDCQ